MAHDIGERRAPLLMHAILLYILIRQSITVDVIPELYFFFLGAMLSTLAALLFVLIKIRVSLHMMAMGGFLFFLMGLGLHNGINILNTIAFWMVMTGLTGSSRLYLGAHDMKELMIGFFFGMIPQLVLWHFWL